MLLSATELLIVTTLVGTELFLSILPLLSKLVETSQQIQKLREEWVKSELMTVGHRERKRDKILTNGILAPKLMDFSQQTQSSSGMLTALWAQEPHLTVI